MCRFLCIAWPLLFAVAHAVRVPEDVQELAAQRDERNGGTIASETAPEKVVPSQTSASAMQTSHSYVHRRRVSRRSEDVQELAAQHGERNGVAPSQTSASAMQASSAAVISSRRVYSYQHRRREYRRR